MRKNIKFYIWLLFIALLLLPLFMDLFYFNKWGCNYLLESSVFGFNYGRFFSEFFYDKSIFIGGNNTISLIAHSFLYYILYLMQFVFSPVNSFFVFLMITTSLSYCYFIKLFSEFRAIFVDKKDNIFHFLLICILGLIFTTSISNFLFLTSTIAFLLPALIMPIQLYFLVRFVMNEEKKGIIFFIILNFLNTFNIASFLINVFFINIFLYILFYLKYEKNINARCFKKILFINISFIPFLMIFFLQLFIGPMYIGLLSDFAGSIREDFYSNNASYLSTFTQTNFWALFGSFNGKLYYEFSEFYKNEYIYIYSFIPYVLISFFLAKKAVYTCNKKLNKFIVFLLLLLLFIFQFMNGLNNLIYKFLYENLTIFQIFRNITKFAPLLSFLTTLILFMLIIKNNIESFVKKCALLLIIALSLIYNIPYWSYHSYFFEKRSAIDVPQSYLDTASFLNKQLTSNDRALVLPATYALENYYWNNDKIAIQGEIFNVLLNNGIKSYRLTQGFTGTVFFRKDSANLFIKGNTNARKLDIDYELLLNFVKKYGLNYIVVTKDLVSEYQDVDDLRIWLNHNNYRKINSFGNNDVYLNSNIFKPILSFDGDIYFERKNAKNYNIIIKNIKKSSHGKLIFLESFSNYWNLYLKPISESHDCDSVKNYVSINNYSNVFSVNECNYEQKIIEKGELSYLYKKSIFDDTHKIVNQYANKWTIDPEYIKQNFSKEYYRENPDGSIDVEMVLYFKPQSYFYLGLIISGTTLISCLGYLLYDWRKRRKLIKKPQTLDTP